MAEACLEYFYFVKYKCSQGGNPSSPIIHLYLSENRFGSPFFFFFWEKGGWIFFKRNIHYSFALWHYGRKWRETKEPLDESERGESEKKLA